VPELLEVEYYRRLAERTVGRRIAHVEVPDPRYLRRSSGATAPVEALVGASVGATERHGKLLLMVLDDGPVLGLRFGMTGRLVVDGVAAIEKLEYASGRDEPSWVRFGLHFDDGGTLVVSDPRRLGRVELDPSLHRLGPDALTVREAALGAALAGGTGAIKARLMDQSRLAGLGNLLTDEILWRAGIDPTRPAGSLSPGELRRLHRMLRATLVELDERGGSHTGELFPGRVRGGTCPRCGVPLRRSTVGARTTFWCPVEQR